MLGGVPILVEGRDRQQGRSAERRRRWSALDSASSWAPSWAWEVSRGLADANQLQVATDVKNQLDVLRKQLPQGTQLQITNDNSIFTRSSLDAIQRDLVLAVFLVGAVMLLFLHQWRNTLIVLFAIPTVLIATFLFMFALGFTLNIMTLMALALMIGILVDDSIVVLENIHRHLELGEGAREAALYRADVVHLLVREGQVEGARALLAKLDAAHTLHAGAAPRARPISTHSSRRSRPS